MLLPADADLVRRDAAVPGLARVLDEDRLLETIRAAAPGAGIDGITASYVRYKPGTSCLVGFDLVAGGQSIPGWALALRRGDADKFRKSSGHRRIETVLGTGPIACDDDQVVIASFPLDPDLDQLPLLTDETRRRKFLRRCLPERPALHKAIPQLLAYRRGRRYVAKIAKRESVACLRLYTPATFPDAARAASILNATPGADIPRVIAIHPRYRAISVEWAAGRTPDLRAADTPVEAIGAALARLHATRAELLIRTTDIEARHILGVAEAVGALCPEMADLAEHIARRAADILALGANPSVEPACIHGDFHARQVLVDSSRSTATLIDFDECCRAEPAADIGNFLAHAAVDHQCTDGQIATLRSRLLQGYGPIDESHIEIWFVASLLRLATSPFRSRQTDWPRCIEGILHRADRCLAALQPRASPQAMDRPAIDTAMPFLQEALDPAAMRARLAAIGAGDLQEISVVRHKPGRRCLVAYRLAIAEGAEQTLLGKIRAKGVDTHTYDLMRRLRLAGLDGARSAAAVPEPIAIFPELHMWLQRKVPGSSALDELKSKRASIAAARIAEALHALHSAGVSTLKTHGLGQECATLRARLASVSQAQSQLKPAIERVLALADQAASRCPVRPVAGLHRDFYHDQMLLDEQRVWLLDLDCHAAGDPALDAGNFIAHLIEYSIRTTGRTDAIAEAERAFRDRFIELTGGKTAETTFAVALYTELSLARHIWISTLHPDRRHTTEMLIDLCSRRLAEFA